MKSKNYFMISLEQGNIIFTARYLENNLLSDISV